MSRPVPQIQTQMQVIINPDRKDWKTILQRPYADNAAILQSVQEILNEVKEGGDKAVKKLTQRFTGVVLDDFSVSEEEVNAAENKLSEELKAAIQQAKKNIEAFHQKQIVKTELIETMPGIQCWRKSVGIEKVGLYIPGGTAPLFSTVLMLAIPATLAGCKEIILCTPATSLSNFVKKDSLPFPFSIGEGSRRPDEAGAGDEVHPAILYAAQLTGVTKIFKIGGAQAIAAMAYGTETIPAVYKIFGPGNQYVTAAKQLVQMQGIAIDMPAGPSEVCVMADKSANASFVAADLLSQAEHGADSQVLLVSSELSVVSKVQDELEKQLLRLPRKEMAQKALANSKAIVVKNMDAAISTLR